MPPEPLSSFNEEKAASYQANRAHLAPLKAALHLLTGVVFGPLPADARVLIVGAGTGAELLALAKGHPDWRFTVVEPAPAMMSRCEASAAKAGVAQRCTFHPGYLDTLPECAPFHAATSILVSHFLVDVQARGAFYAAIAGRLRPGGVLVNADLSADPAATGHAELLRIWLESMKMAGLPLDARAFGHNVGLLAPRAVEELLSQSGFADPTHFFQTLLIHAWFARTPR